MSFTLVDYVRHQANLKGYKPRFGVEIPDLLQNFSRSAPFTVTVDSGADGVFNSVFDPEFFTSATLDTTDVVLGDSLTITGGVDAGTYTITSIASSTTVVCAGESFTTASGQVWKIKRTYQDLLSSYPTIKMYSDELGGYSPQSDLTLGILNEGLWSNIFATYANPENSGVNIYLYFDDSTDILLAERMLVYTGKIKTFPNMNYGTVKLSITDETILKAKKVGTFVTTSDAVNNILPDESVGKLRPIIYGDRRSFVGDTDTTLTVLDRNSNFVPSVYLGIDDDDNQHWLISDHAVNAVDEIWQWDSDIERMVKTKAFTVVQNTASGCIIKIANLGNVYDFWYPNGITVNNINNTATISNESNSSDNDKTTFAQIDVDDTSQDVTKRNDAEIFVRFSDWDHQQVLDASNVVDVEAYVKTDWDEGTFNGVTHSRCEVDVLSGITAGPVDAKTYDTTTFNNPFEIMTDSGVNAATAIVTDMLFSAFGAYDVAGGFSDTNWMKIYACFKRIEYTPIKFMPVFFGGRGREYGTWMDGRTIANGYTEDHIDTDKTLAGTGAIVIENGAGVIESMLREELGMGAEASALPATDTDIYRDSYNVASNDLSTTVMSFEILKQSTWPDTVNEISNRLKSNSHFNADDRMKMIVFNGIAGFSASGKTVPNNWDIYEYSPVETFLIITGTNDKLYIDGNTFTLTAGQYTGASLASQIETQLDTVYVGGITCIYSSTTGLFKFKDDAAAGAYTIKWLTGGVQNVGRFIGFDISADDTLPLGGELYSDFGIWADSWVENPIANGSFSLSKQSEDIITDVTVNYFKNSRGDYQAITNTTDNTYHAEVIADIFDYDYTKDSATAIIYRDFLLNRLAKRHYMTTFKTYINAIHVEMWDIINIRHPILAGIFTTATMNAKEWVVLNVSIDTSTMEVTVTAIEV